MNAARFAARPLGRVADLGDPRVEQVLSFPPFVLDVGQERLWLAGRPVPLRPKPFAILSYLACNPARLITHDELVDAVWGKIAMSESLLRTHVRDVRRALGNNVIETVMGRGYRFVAKITRDRPTSAEVHDSSATRVVGEADSTELVGDSPARPRAHLTRMRLQLAVVRAVADELASSLCGDRAQGPSAFLEQLAQELERLARGLRGWEEADVGGRHE